MITTSPRLLASAVAVVGCLALTLVVSRPEPVAVAAPFALVLVLGLGVRRETEVGVTISAAPRLLVEGEDVCVDVAVTGAGTGWVGIELDPPAGLSTDDALGTEVATEHGQVARLQARFTCTQWGASAPFRATVVVHDRLRLVTRTLTAEGTGVQVRPSDERIRSLLQPRVLRAVPGSHLSRQRSEGIDFADIRPFALGDRVRSVNWRASARRGELWINDRHPDRSGDLVLFLDTFEEVGEGADGTLHRCVDGALALAGAHLAANDRVGLVDMGGVFRWVRQAGGSAQLHRIVEALGSSRVHSSTAGKTIDVLPVRALPRRSLVVALSPLLDPRGVAAIEELGRRGYDLVVVECSPVGQVPAGAGRPRALAHRLWSLEREVVRARLREGGVTVVEWHPGTPFASVLREVLVSRQALQRWAR